jgi:hypothetical protein
MNILVVAPYSINNPHFDTDLEIIHAHLDQFDKVTLISCNANLLACDVNHDHDILTCLECVGRRYQGIKLLPHKIEIKSLYFLRDDNRKEIKSIKTKFNDTKELKRFKIDNFDVGMAVLSSIVSYSREPNPSLPKYQNLIEKYIVSSLAVYRSVQNHLSYANFDRVYVYNGRYAPLRAVLRACQSKNIDCFCHERGSSLDKYSLTKNTLPHDITYVEKSIRESFEVGYSSDKQKTLQVAHNFFINRSQGISGSWYSFTKNQSDDLLPDNWNDNKNNIVIFLSSEDEFTAIGEEWSNPIYDNQQHGISKILESIKNDENIHLYLRIHPNLKGINNTQTQWLSSLEENNLTVISPDSPISSYTLLKKASKIITFGSTVGIESAYWGTPSVLAGQCFYRNLGSTYNPTNHKELISLLNQSLLPNSKEGALMYGYYMGSYGVKFKYYNATSIFDGFFKGTNIQPCWLAKILIQFVDSNIGKKSKYFFNLFLMIYSRKKINT